MTAAPRCSDRSRSGTTRLEPPAPRKPFTARSSDRSAALGWSLARSAGTQLNAACRATAGSTGRSRGPAWDRQVRQYGGDQVVPAPQLGGGWCGLVRVVVSCAGEAVPGLPNPPGVRSESAPQRRQGGTGLLRLVVKLLA